MSRTGFCGDCTFWRFEENEQFRSEDERDGFGLCERIEDMKANRSRAIARADDEFASVQTRREFGCVLMEAK